MLRRCPKCRGDLEMHIDEEPKDTQPGYLPTKAYLFCPHCHDCFPTYDEKDES